MVTQKVVSVRGHQNGVRGHFARSLPHHISAPSCQRPSAKRRRRGGHRRTKPRSRRTLLDAGRGRVLESMSWFGCCSSACELRVRLWTD